MKHSDHITHINNEEDVPYLKSKLLDVNIRLLKTSRYYRHIVWESIKLIDMLTITKMEGYKLPHGMSGANAGIPWNIIGIARNRGTQNAYAEIMINPKIIGYVGEIVNTQSNCGSLTLEEPITVRRSSIIDITYYDKYGQFHEERRSRNQAAFTIQHEVDHNLGILITDYINK